VVCHVEEGHRPRVFKNKARRLHNAELHDLYFSANFIKVIKLRRMR